MNRLKQFMPSGAWAIEPEERDELIGYGCRLPEWEMPSYSQSQFSRELIQSLVDELSGKADENQFLRKRIDDLARRLEKQEQLLKEFLDPVKLPAHGSFEAWLASEEAVQKYRGKHVAFILGKGVIASSETLDGLVAQIGDAIRQPDTSIGFVPLISTSVLKC